MIKISRKEQQVLRNLKNVMAAEQSEFITLDMMANQTDQDTAAGLVEKGILIYNEGPSDTYNYTITKDQLQVEDDDPEVEQAWEDFRAVQGNGSMTKLYERNKEAEKANKRLEQVLFKKGRLTHMVNSDNVHVWVTEDKVQYWQDRKFKEASPAAVPAGL